MSTIATSRPTGPGVQRRTKHVGLPAPAIPGPRKPTPPEDEAVARFATLLEEAAPARPAPATAAAKEWALVESAKAGDADAFGQLYNLHMDTVYRYIRFRVSNAMTAQDLTHDTFLRALKRIGKIEWQGKSICAWLVTIARNLVADHYKSGRYRLEVTVDDVSEAHPLDQSELGHPAATVEDHLTNLALIAVVKQLNPEQQECIVLRFLAGYSVAETASIMGKNQGAIKALQYRAVRTIQRLLPEGFA